MKHFNTIKAHWLTESSSALFVVLSPTLSIISASNKYLEMAILEQEMVIGKPFFDAFINYPDFDKDNLLKQSIETVYKTKRRHHLTIDIYKALPNIILSSKAQIICNTPLFNEDGDIVCIVHEVKEVEEVFSETLLPQSNSQVNNNLGKGPDSNQFDLASAHNFRGLLEAAPDAMVIANEKGEIVLINKQTENMFGYTKDELIGKQVELLIPSEYKHTHTQHRQSYFKDPKVRSMGAGLELFAVRKNGERFAVEISLSPMQSDEGNLITAAIRDITERKKDEAKFKGLLESAPDAMIIANREGAIVLANQQAVALFGYSKEELLHTQVEQLIPQEIRQQHQQHRAGYYKEPRVRSMGAGLELFAIKKDGTKFPVEISLSPLETNEGTLVSAAIRDISERKQADESIRQLNKELESFTYSVSHDLRSPLRIIDGYADILLKDYDAKLDDDGMRTLKVIKNNARRMGQLIDDLLNLSRTNRKELVVQKVNMHRLLETVIEELLVTISNQPEINTGSILPTYCDSNLIRQVFTNLISNAIKYSSNNSHPKIEIGSYKEEQEIIYYIKDNGVGFDMRYAEKLFGVFQRLHKITEFEGTGVGLALAKRIIDRHGGKIWAEAALGNGATFYFSLPINPISLTIKTDY